MLVSFLDIPSAFLTPLNVDTNVRYTLDMKKFPGLSSDGRTEPALMPAPQIVPTDNPDRSRQSCSEQFCLSQHTTPTTLTSCRYKSSHSTPLLVKSQRDLYELLGSYQGDSLDVSPNVPSTDVTGDTPILIKGNCMDSSQRNINQHEGMCVISPRKMLSGCPQIPSSNLNSCPSSTTQFVPCTHCKESQYSMRSGGRQLRRFHNGSLNTGVCGNVTLQNYSGSSETNISDGGVRQGFTFTQPLFEPELCKVTFPASDYVTEKGSQFATDHRFDKRSCSFRNRAVPYTPPRNVYLEGMTNNDSFRVLNSSQCITPVMYDSLINFRPFYSQTGFVNYDMCLRV